MSGSRSLRERIAGQSAMNDVVVAQRSAPARSLAARVFGISPLTVASRESYRGALGELIVGDVLDNLGPRWDVLHDLPLGETLLDHLIIGPAGVFTVHVTNTNGLDVVVDRTTILVTGHPIDDIAAATSEADVTAQLLSEAAGIPVKAQPLLVLVEPRRLTVRTPAPGVRIVPSYQLERMLARAVPTLDGLSVAALSDLADLATTWPAVPGLTPDTLTLHQDFALVRAQVQGALVRRVLWGTLGITVLYCVVLALIASLVSVVIAP